MMLTRLNWTSTETPRGTVCFFSFFLPQVSPSTSSHSRPPLRPQSCPLSETICYTKWRSPGTSALMGWGGGEVDSMLYWLTVLYNTYKTANISSQNEFPVWVRPTELVWDLFMMPLTHLWEGGGRVVWTKGYTSKIQTATALNVEIHWDW